jgi:hypothetical protein
MISAQNPNQAPNALPAIPATEYIPRTAAVLSQIPIGTDKIDPNSKNIKTYYARYNGCRYYFQDGGVATFTGGRYEIDAGNPDNALRVKELEYVMDASSPLFSRVPVRMMRSDSIQLRAVDRSGGAAPTPEPEYFDEQPEQPSSVGMVTSKTLTNAA